MINCSLNLDILTLFFSMAATDARSIHRPLPAFVHFKLTEQRSEQKRREDTRRKMGRARLEEKEWRENIFTVFDEPQHHFAPSSIKAVSCSVPMRLPTTTGYWNVQYLIVENRVHRRAITDALCIAVHKVKTNDKKDANKSCNNYIIIWLLVQIARLLITCMYTQHCLAYAVYTVRIVYFLEFRLVDPVHCVLTPAADVCRTAAIHTQTTTRIQRSSAPQETGD